MAEQPFTITSGADNSAAGAITDGDVAGAKERFGREYKQTDPNAQQAGIDAYTSPRSQGQDHETAYQNAVKQMGWPDPAKQNSPSAPQTPVTATGGIPPPAPPPPAQGQNQRLAQPVGPAPTYNPTQFSNTLQQNPVSQFSAPDQSGMNAQQNSLMSAILANPQTMDANTVAQMKEAQKEQALLMGKQDAGSYAQSAIGRGTLNGGQTTAFRAANNNNVNNQILTGNRDVDLAAVAHNRQDQLNALGASSNLQQDQLGRAINGYNTTLGGQQAQNSNNLAGAQFGLGVQQANANQNQLGYQSQKDANDAAYARSMGYAQNAQSVYGQDVSTQLAQQAAQLDLQKFLEQQDEFNKSLGQQNSQFGQQLGYNYNQLDANTNLNLLNAIRGISG